MSDIDPLHHHPFKPSFPGAMICVEHTEMLPSGVCGYPATHEVHAVVSLDVPRAGVVSAHPVSDELRLHLDLFESRVRAAVELAMAGKYVPESLRAGVDSARERLIELYAREQRS